MLTYRGVPLEGGVLVRRLQGKRGWAQLFRAAEPEDRHWAVTVVGLIRFGKAE
jgi:hypothetical protein